MTQECLIQAIMEMLQDVILDDPSFQSNTISDDELMVSFELMGSGVNGQVFSAYVHRPTEGEFFHVSVRCGEVVDIIAKTKPCEHNEAMLYREFFM